MFDVISKAEYFAALDDPQILAFLRNSPYDLKHVQDAYMYNLLKGLKDKRIIEIGGGNSRLLRGLDSSNELWNLDEFDGRDGGPSEIVIIDHVKNVIGRLGHFDKSLPENYFDVLFSISVIEHMPTEQSLIDFFLDSARITKVGGVIHHTIDLYVQDEPLDYSSKRLSMYLTLSEQNGLKFIDNPSIDADLRFKCRYATNPDIGMYGWNKVVPQLKLLRLESQSISLKMALMKHDQ